MEIKQRYLDTIDDLAKMADGIEKNSHSNIMEVPKDHADKSEFVSGAKQLIEGLFGVTSPSYLELTQAENHFHYNNGNRYIAIKGVLLAAKKRIEQGWLSNTRNELFAEIFADYLEMAEYLNGKGMHIAAAVIAGTTLEERVRLLSKKYFDTDKKPNGEPQSVENLNNALREHYVNKLTDVRTVVTYYGVRTQAAHGEWNHDTPEQKRLRIGTVDLMIKTINDFINRNSL